MEKEMKKKRLKDEMCSQWHSFLKRVRELELISLSSERCLKLPLFTLKRINYLMSQITEFMNM